VGELGRAQALGDGAEPDPPAGLGGDVAEVGVLGVLGRDALEGLARRHPFAARAKALDRLQHQARELFGIPRDRLRHRAVLQRA